MQNFEDPNKNSKVVWKYFWEALNGYTSVFMLHSNVFNRTRDRIKRLTNFRQIQGPLIYLWCPIFIGRPMIMCFYDLVNKVVCRITGWQTKQLSYGGKALLTKNVLQAIHIHLLFVVTPPSSVIKQIQRLMVDFFWGWRNGRKRYHWASWKNLSFPYEEGGGMKSLKDICRAFQFKQ